MTESMGSFQWKAINSEKHQTCAEHEAWRVPPAPMNDYCKKKKKKSWFITSVWASSVQHDALDYINIARCSF